MGVNRGTVANWEQGLAAISLPMAMRWFTCCGVSVARYMDACIHPGLLEHLEDGLSDYTFGTEITVQTTSAF